MRVELAHRSTGEIISLDTRLSRVSRMRRRVSAWADCVREAADQAETEMLMVTLTYRQPVDWRPRHISGFIAWARRHWEIKAYAWVGELQRRGAVHYHVLLLVAKPYSRLQPDRMGGWTHGHTRVERARTPFYVLKYAQKGADDDENKFPRGMRIFSVWVSRGLLDRLSAAARERWRLSVWPAWVRDIAREHGSGVSVQRAPGGGVRVGDKYYPSPYVLWKISKLA